VTSKNTKRLIASHAAVILSEAKNPCSWLLSELPRFFAPLRMTDHSSPYLRSS